VRDRIGLGSLFLSRLGWALLEYSDQGTGRPVLLVHAGIADRRMWQPQVDHFSDAWRLICPDLRGFGGSSHGSDPYRHSWDLAELLDRLEVSDVTVVGASMGGAASLDLALDRPDLVGGLVLVGSVYDGFRFEDDDLVSQWRQLTAVYETGDLDATAQLEASMWLGADTDIEVRRLVVDMVRRSYEFAEVDEADVTVPAGQRMGSLAVPTLVVIGDDDRSDIKRAAEHLVSGIDRAELVTIPNAAHLPSLERPYLFNEQLTGFLSSRT
jgi:3-oxoadipate enol-lactonase